MIFFWKVCPKTSINQNCVITNKFGFRMIVWLHLFQRRASILLKMESLLFKKKMEPHALEKNVILLAASKTGFQYTDQRHICTWAWIKVNGQPLSGTIHYIKAFASFLFTVHLKMWCIRHYTNHSCWTTNMSMEHPAIIVIWMLFFPCYNWASILMQNCIEWFRYKCSSLGRVKRIVFLWKYEAEK